MSSKFTIRISQIRHLEAALEQAIILRLILTMIRVRFRHEKSIFSLTFFKLPLLADTEKISVETGPEGFTFAARIRKDL